jgi:hypothetical protein
MMALAFKRSNRETGLGPESPACIFKLDTCHSYSKFDFVAQIRGKEFSQQRGAEFSFLKELKKNFRLILESCSNLAR